MKINCLYSILVSLLLSFNAATASTISIGGGIGIPDSGGPEPVPIEIENVFNILLDGNLFLDISIFSSNQVIDLNANTSLIANNISVFDYDSFPTQPGSSVTIINALNLSFNASGDVLLFSDVPASSGVFEATNIYIGNYSSLAPVPLPAPFILFLSGMAALFGKSVLSKRQLSSSI